MRDLKTENFLTSHGYKWEYREKIPFSEIDLKYSLENPMRFAKPLDEERVNKWCEQMKQGVEFNALVLLNVIRPDCAFDWEIATGNHRSKSAIKAGINWFDAYVVIEPVIRRRAVLAARINTLEGVAPPIKEEMRTLIQVHVMHKVPLRQLALESGFSYNVLQDLFNELRAQERGQEHSFNFEKLGFPKKTIIQLNRIKNDTIYKRACEILGVRKPSVWSIADDLIAGLLKDRTEAAALKRIEQYMADSVSYEDTSVSKFKSTKIKPTKATKVMRAVNSILNLVSDADGIENIFMTTLPDRSKHIVSLKKSLDIHMEAISILEKAEEAELLLSERKIK